MLTLVVEKNTYQVKNLTLEFDSDVTVQGQKAKRFIHGQHLGQRNP